MLPHLNEGQPVRTMGLDADEMELIKGLHLITAKPAMFVANVSESGFTNNPLLDQLTEFANKQNAPIVAISPRSNRKSPTWTTPTRPSS
jgi:ribosome-binding ATPase YchF (GTP1/OBG family)